MKVFIVGYRDEKGNSDLLKIANEVEKQGHTVDKGYIKRTLKDDAENFEEAYKKNMNSIKKADVIIAEVSDMASGIGFLISAALNQKKPVLTLFNEDSKEKQSTTLKGTKNKLMTYVVYNDESLNSVLKSFFNKVKSILDTKFILIISAEIDRYLEWASDTRRMHKAQLVRNAIEDMMSKDKEWKKYQEKGEF